MLEAHHADIPACKDCLQWIYEPDKKWKPMMRQGRRVPRNGGAPPCWKCPKGPQPHLNEPTRTTLRTIDYFHQCQADVTGMLPRDRRVIENNALIARFKEQTVRNDLDLLAMLLGAMRRQRYERRND